MPLFQALKNIRSLNIILVFTTLIFFVSLYLMATLPGEKNFSCVLGAALNKENIVFSLLMSLLTSVIIASLVSLYFYKQFHSKEISLGVTSGLGAFVGMFTVFCTFCTFPIISLFGFSFAVSWFTDYNLYFKFISFLLLLGSLYFINKQLKGNCLCKTK
jgi:hypothetical protein